MTSTTQQNYSDNSNNSAAMRGYLANFFSKELFINNLKRNKIFMIIITVILGFSCPLVGYLAVFNGENANKNLAEVLGVIVILLAVLFAVILALNAMNYTHNKISATFFNSLPIKKTCLFTTQFISGVVYFLLPLIIIYLPTVVLFLSGSYAGTLTSGFIWAALLFLLTYSFVVLAANVSGTMFSSLIVFAYFNLYLISIFGMAGAFVETFYSFTDSSFIFIDTIMIKTSPMIYYIWKVFEHSLNDFSVPEFLVTVAGMILFSAAFYAGGLYLNKINKTENAGKSINFKIFERIFKYSLLALTALVGGTAFAASMGRNNYVMFLFGILIFVFISFMLINFIINRNIREVFKGIKSLGIFTAIVCVVLFTFSLDVFGLDKYMPNINSVESIRVYSSNNAMYYHTHRNETEYEKNGYYSYSNDLNISDPAAIALMYDIFDTAMNKGKISDYYSQDEEEFIYHYYNNLISLYNISFDLQNGKNVPKKIPYRIKFDNKQDYDEFDSLVKSFAESEGFKKAYFAPIFDNEFLNTLTKPEAKANINLAVYRRVDDAYKDYGYNIYSYAANGEVVLNQNLSVPQLAEVFLNARNDIMLLSDKAIQGSEYYYYSVILKISYLEYRNGELVNISHEIAIGMDDGVNPNCFGNLMDYLETNFKFSEN